MQRPKRKLKELKRVPGEKLFKTFYPLCGFHFDPGICAEQNSAPPPVYHTLFILPAFVVAAIFCFQDRVTDNWFYNRPHP